MYHLVKNDGYDLNQTSNFTNEKSSFNVIESLMREQYRKGVKKDHNRF